MIYLSKQTIVKQKGAALIVLVLAFLMATSVLVISNYSIDKGKIAYEKRTSMALAKAKEALLAYAVSFYENDANHTGLYGFLPCPETTTSANGEGHESLTCLARYYHSIGRLPWKSLRIEPLKDGAGECLWYAISGGYKNGSTRSYMHNEDTPGFFIINDENGNVITGGAPEDRIVAVIIAPGSKLAGQNRLAATPGLPCKVAFNLVVASEYLETNGVIDNASLDSVDGIDNLIKPTSQLNNPNINDQIITISQNEIFSAIQKSTNFQLRMNVLAEGLAVCVKDYTINNNVVPGGGCDLTACLQQCSVDQTACYNQCVSCSIQCDLDYDACIAAGTKKKTCNTNRKNCNNACPKIKQCEKSCDTVFTNCETVCNTNCTPGGGGGGGNNFWLPWPSVIDFSLNASPLDDYRLQDNYDDNNSNVLPVGRLPFLIDDSNVNTGNPTANLFVDCTTINASLNGVNGIDLSTENDEYRMLWRHWKDHLFYAIGSGFEASNATATATPDCAVTPASCVNVYNSATATTNAYAAVVIYAGTRSMAQLRRAAPPEAAPVLAVESKGDIYNYLESWDAANNRFDFSLGNDIAYCISSSMVVTKCLP